MKQKKHNNSIEFAAFGGRTSLISNVRFRMKHIYLLIIFFSASVLAEPDYSESFAEMQKIDRFAYDGPGFLKGLSIEKIRELGELKKEIKEVEYNYESEKVPYYTFIFKDGLEVTCRFVTNHVSGDHVQLISVKITSKKWPISSNLGVGKEIAKVNDFLGSPRVINSSIQFYRGETEEVHFTHKNGVITEIEFIYYAD